jgi:hypothetical protein
MGVLNGTTLTGGKLYPAFSVYEGWDHDDGNDHRYNPVSNISWAEDLTYLGHAGNRRGKPTVSYTAKLPAGRYTIAIGGANYLFCAESAPCYNGRHGYEATLTTTPFRGRPDSGHEID